MCCFVNAEIRRFGAEVRSRVNPPHGRASETGGIDENEHIPGDGDSDLFHAHRHVLFGVMELSTD